MYIKCNGINIYYEQSGTGSPLLLLHGGIITSRYNWKPHIDYLSHFFHVIVPDTRGHGLTRHNQEAFSYKSLADDISAFVHKLELKEPPIICGHSDGAIIGMHVAVHYPELVKKLVIIGGAHLTGISKNYNKGIQDIFCTKYPEKGSNIWCYCFSKPFQTLWLWYAHKWYTHKWYTHKKVRWQQLMTKLWPMWITPIQLDRNGFQKLTAETLIIVGDLDEFIAVKENQQLADMIPNAKLTILKGYDHMFPVNFPRELQEVLLPFVLGSD